MSGGINQGSVRHDYKHAHIIFAYGHSPGDIWPCLQFVVLDAVRQSGAEREYRIYDLFHKVSANKSIFNRDNTIVSWDHNVVYFILMKANRYLLKVKDIFDVQCMKFWYKFVNKKLPNYFRDMFKYNHEVHDIETRSHDQLHLYPTRTSGALSVLRHHIPELLNTFPKNLINEIKTHSLYSISHHIKCYLIDLYSYDCSIFDCYICNNIWKWQVAEVETLVLRPTVIAERSLGSRNGNPVGGRRLVSGRWFLRFSKDTNGSITLRSISTRAWIMTLFAMASLIEFVPLLCLCILEPVRELTHWGRVTHIWVGKLTIIGSDNDLSPGRRQAIIWPNAGILLIEPLGTNFSESLIGIQIFSFTKMRMKMSSVKWRPFCLGLNVLTHYFRRLNAKEANPQCTEAASLVSFALSHPFVICHQLNITLYCAYITTAHAFPFRVASMPAVRYDLSGGLPTCLWLFIYQDYESDMFRKFMWRKFENSSIVFMPNVNCSANFISSCLRLSKYLALYISTLWHYIPSKLRTHMQV